MTGTTDWANRYLDRKRGANGTDREEATSLGFAPEASEYMDDLSPFELSHLPRKHRVDYLAAIVHALVAAMECEADVAERHRGTRRAVAYSNEEPIVGLLDGFGEVISLDRETAALVAFAYYLEPEAREGDSDAD